MKKNYPSPSGAKVRRLSQLAVASVFAFSGFVSAQTYTFTSAGLSGSVGPTQAQINTAYASTNLSGLVTVASGIQSWTVPATGMYEITAFGPQGGNSSDNIAGGLGAKIKGEFNLTAGTVLDIVVGHRGDNAPTSACGGGAGGSGVRQGATLLIVAGGGGGGGKSGNTGVGANSGNNGTSSSSGAISGGTGGNGGNAAASNGGGCGGGGMLTAGAKPPGGTPNQAGPGGFAAAGGAQSIWCGGTAGAGGFGVGGGGGGEGQHGGGGGGGGYSGGAGGEWSASGWCSTGPAYGGGGGGSYNIGSNAVNTGSFNTGDGKVVINRMCDVLVNGNTSICSGQSATLSTTAVNNIQWSSGATTPTVILSPQSTTQYTLSGNGTQNNCAAVIVFSVVVNQLPSVVVTPSPALLCVGQQASLTATGAASYTWSSGPTGSVTTVSPAVTTQYTVTATSSVGCVNSYVFSVPVNSLELTVSGNTAVCIGKTATLTGSGGTNLAWSGFGPFSTINPQPSTTTVYTLTGIDANNCQLTKTVTLAVNPNPTVTAGASNTLVCKGSVLTLTAGGASSYAWSSSAGSSTASVVSLTPAINTIYTYSVTGTDVNGCQGTASINVRVELCSGIAEHNLSEGFSVYPNPSNGMINVKAQAGASLSLINLLGQTVTSAVVPESGLMQLQGLAQGAYIVRCEYNGKIGQLKVIVD